MEGNFLKNPLQGENREKIKALIIINNLLTGN